MEKIFNKIEEYFLYFLVLVLPIFAVPISPSPFVVSKLAFLSFSVAILLLLRVIRIILQGKFEIKGSHYDLPMLLIAGSYIASTILRTPNKMEALLLPGNTTLVAGSVLLFFFINQQKSAVKEKIAQFLVFSGFAYALISIFSALGLFSKIPQIPNMYKSNTYTPEGGYLPSAMFILIILPISLSLILSGKKITEKVMYGVFSSVMIMSLIFFVFKMLPGKTAYPRFPSFSTGWSIAIDSIKESPLLGVGPGNYLTSFNRFRPISYNSTDLWSIKFTTARNFYITVLTETGLLGFFAFSLLLFSFYKIFRKDLKEKQVVNWGFSGISKLISLAGTLVMLFFFPPTPLLLIVLFILFAVNSSTKSTELNLTTKESNIDNQLAQNAVSRLPAILITLPVVVVLILFFINAPKIVLAEYRFTKSLMAITENDSAKTYKYIVSAIQTNRLVDRYRSVLSQIDLLLANSLAQKQDLTDEDRNNISQLIQQSISESKAAVALNPARSGNWYNLGITYQSIIPFTKGADAFAAQSFSQAIALDPLNPNIRIALGGIYYAAKNYDTAIRVFELAVRAKTDLPNAHYNLAYAYNESGKYDLAIGQMSLVLSLVDNASKDYETAKKALEDFQNKKKVTENPPASENLTPPQETESVIQPPIELPEGSEPPATQLTPSVTPTPTEGVLTGEETPTSTITPTPTL